MIICPSTIQSATIQSETIRYLPLQPDHFNAVISLGEQVHGANYLDLDGVHQLYEKGIQKDVNASWVALSESNDSLALCDTTNRLTQNGFLVGFRLTIAAGNWQPDKWCTPESWSMPVAQVCYFKSNTVDARARGQGIGSTLLKYAIESAKQQGARAGLAHIWLASPNNSAYRYFSHNGGALIKKHANKWRSLSLEEDYYCPECKGICECAAAEMLLKFGN